MLEEEKKEHLMAVDEKEWPPIEAQRAALTEYHNKSERFKEVLRQQGIKAHLRHRDPANGIFQTTSYVWNKDKRTYTSTIISTEDEALCPSLHHDKAEVSSGASGTVKSAFPFDTLEDLEIILAGDPSPLVAKRVYVAKGNLEEEKPKRSPVPEELIINGANISQHTNGHPVTAIAYESRSGKQKCIEIQKRCSGQNVFNYFERFMGKNHPAFTETVEVRQDNMGAHPGSVEARLGAEVEVAWDNWQSAEACLKKEQTQSAQIHLEDALARLKDLSNRLRQEKSQPKSVNLMADNPSPSPITDEDLAEFMYACLIALRDFHDKGYVHEDIKPQNMMYHKDKNVTKLIDFATSSHMDDKKRYEGGTRYYMSPEQHDSFGSGVQLDRKTDIWSMGRTMHKLFLHVMWERRANKEHHLASLRHNDPLSDLIPSLQPLSKLVDRMKSDKLKDRPTADKALRELEQIIAAQYPVLAEKLKLADKFKQEEKQKKWRIFEVAVPTLTIAGTISFLPELGGSALSTLIGGATLFGGVTVGVLLSYFVFPAIVFLIGIATMYVGTQLSQPAVEKSENENNPLSEVVLHQHEPLKPSQDDHIVVVAGVNLVTSSSAFHSPSNPNNQRRGGDDITPLLHSDLPAFSSPQG